MFDDFFSRFFAEPSAGARRGIGGSEPRVEQVDVTQLFSDATRALLQRAAEKAVEWGSLDLDTDHLLHAALEDDVVHHVLQQAGADPKSIAAQIEQDADKGAAHRGRPVVVPRGQAGDPRRLR